MAFIASVYEQMTMDRTGHERPKTIYNRATGKHEKNDAHDMSGELPLDSMRKKHNPTDGKVREHLRRAGA